jgi:tetratricopeptide (TPR) repeat protein
MREADEPGGSRRGLKYGIAALLLLALGAGLWFNQDRLRKLLPSSQVGNSLARADAAFSAGKLTGGADSAAAMYRAIISVDPDNSQAQAGLKRVGEKLVFDARDALAKGDAAAARTLAGQARELLQGGPALDELDAALKKSETQGNQITELLDKAAAALKAGKLLGGDESAAAYYQKALALEAGNAVARKGMGDVLYALAQQAKDSLAQRHPDEAAQRIADIERLDHGFVGLAELKAQLADTRVADTRQLDELLARAETLLKKGQFAAPPGNNALELYREAQKRDPQNAKVKAGLKQIAGALLVAANAAIEAKDTAGAEKILGQAEAIGAAPGELAAARSKLRELKEQGAIAAKPSNITPDQQQQIDKFLGEADAAVGRGDLIEPPGGNAYDMYRGALGLDRNNARAKAGIASIPTRAKELFDKAVSTGHPAPARGYLDAVAAITPSDAGIANMRLKLAQAYVKQADEQITAAQYDAAGRSLAKARELAPDDPSVAAADEKLKAAKGG